MTDLAKHMPAVAQAILGEPNAQISSKRHLRFGNKGSLSVDLDRGTYYDHEAGEGGGVLDLIQRHTGQTNGAAVQWLRDHVSADIGDGGQARVQQQRREKVASYIYEATDGAPYIRVNRWRGGGARFTQDRWDGQGWTAGTKGMSPVPYRLPALRAAVGRQTVLIVEGEKDADNAKALGLAATTNAGGAGKWRPALNDHFDGANVVIVADADKPGRDHANDVARHLYPRAASIRVIDFADLGEKKDLSDYIEARRADGADDRDIASEVKARARAAEHWHPPADQAEPRGGEGDGHAAPPLPLEWFGDAALQTDLGDFVEGTLTDGGMSVVYGESNSGKTFFAFDLALRVALGWEWQGKEVEPGGVLYLACEGGYGVRNRELAFRHEHGVTAQAPFATVRTSVNLKGADGDSAKVIQAAEHMRRRTGQGVRLIVVDTLARALAGGEENSSQDMGALVSQVDRIRQETGAHVMLIHHSGKDSAKGARGHSSLRAATDTELEITRPEGGEVASMVVRKQRDLPGEGGCSFQLKQVQLGTDRRGNAVTSCVVEPAETPARATMKTKLSDKQKLFLDAVRNCVIEHGETMRPLDDMPPVRAAGRHHLVKAIGDAGAVDTAPDGTPRYNLIHSYLAKLKNKGLLGFSQHHVWLPDEPTSPTSPDITSTSPVRTGDVGQTSPHLTGPLEGGGEVMSRCGEAGDDDPFSTASEEW